MDVSEYLKRINYTGSTEPTIENLSALHLAHMYAVPFENLDIPLGTPIELDLDKIYTKIISNHRGGFCYELNGLFGSLLKELGFEVEMLAARVYGGDGKLGPEFDHMLLRVNKDFIADVGFGDSFLLPIKFDAGEQQQPNGTFRLKQKQDSWQLEKRDDTLWQPQYLFTEIPRALDEYDEMCLFQQTSPESIFTQKILCSKAIENGRVTYANGRVIETCGKQKDEKMIQNPGELKSLIADVFGFELDGGYDRLLGNQG